MHRVSSGRTDEAAVVENDEPVVVETVLSHDSDEVVVEDDATRPRDAIERTVAMIINLALYFFSALALCTMIMIVIYLAQFGALVLVIVSVLASIVCGLGCFLDKAMREDENWKPVRSKIQEMKDLATAAIFQEVRNFKRDWHEHLLLTDGTVENDGDDILRDDNDPNIFVAADPSNKKKRWGKGGKSVVFQFVKPFLKLRTLGRRRRARNDQTKVDDAYTPPIV